MSLWDKLKAFFARFILGKKTSTEVSRLTSEIYKLIDAVNKNDIDVYTNE